MDEKSEAHLSDLLFATQLEVNRAETQVQAV
jgi:hypothetical protein